MRLTASSARAAFHRARTGRREGVAGAAWLVALALLGAVVFGMAVVALPPILVGLAAAVLVLLPLYIGRDPGKTEVTPRIILKTASVHQKQPPPRTITSFLVLTSI